MSGRGEDKAMLAEIVRLELENQRMEKLLSVKQRELFELQVTCNCMENTIANVEAVLANNPLQLVKASESMCNILGTCAVVTKGRKAPTSAENNYGSDANAASGHKEFAGNKAHVVKPHMVNGHVLYAPTVNLTRISESNRLINNDISGDRNTNSTREQSSADSDDQSGGSNYSIANNSSLSTINEVTEASTSQSPAHSTVLSGTFQEVKIYLNSISENKSASKKNRKSRRKLMNK